KAGDADVAAGNGMALGRYRGGSDGGRIVAGVLRCAGIPPALHTTMKESRLDEIGEEAARSGRVEAKNYYNLPLLKKPVWTWEVPAYFFVGGAAGASSMIAAAAQLEGADRKLVRDAR